MNAIKWIFAWLVPVALNLSVGLPAQAAQVPRGGMPLPWPFPWAKECPVDWMSLRGYYLLFDDLDGEQISISVTPLFENKNYLVRVTHYGRGGQKRAEGVSLVRAHQRALSVRLASANQLDGHSGWVVIKQYFQSSIANCSSEYLIPIMTMDSAESQYRLVRQP